MPAITFYQLNVRPVEKVLPSLLVKAYEQGIRAVVFMAGEEQVEDMVKTLWTFSDAIYLPHGCAKDGYVEKQPIYLTAKEENPNGAQALFITSETMPGFAGEFQRCAELFDGTQPEKLTSARQRFQAYVQQGCEASWWQENARGGWEKVVV